MNFFKTGVGQCRWPLPGFLIHKPLGISRRVFRLFFLESHFLFKYFFWRFYEFMNIPPESVEDWFLDFYLTNSLEFLDDPLDFIS